jgi:hypothetical protein
MMTSIIENGRITGVEIQFDRGFALSCWVHIEFDGSGQGFGGYVLGGNPFDQSAVCARHDEQANFAADFIGGVMACADVERLSDAKGNVIRVRRDEHFGPIVAIGHPFKDRWYEPAVRLGAIAKAKGAAS